MAPLYPLLTERRFQQPVWGGSRLAQWLALPQPHPERLGEAWQVFDTNHVRNGAYHGMALSDVIRRHGADLVGTLSYAHYGADLPLLAKFIDAGQDLSIQVHPDDEYAHRVEQQSGYHGKNEAWYVLDAVAGATVTLGLQRQVSRTEFERAIADDRVLDLLQRLPVAAGDLIYVPAGTIHAINAGILLFEIQQKSDLTYRVYDYGRRDQHGNLRELHVTKALAVSRLTPPSVRRIAATAIAPGHDLLVAAPSFALERLELNGSCALQTERSSLEIWTVLQGAAQLTAGDQVVDLPRGESVLLPAALGAFELQGSATLLRAYVPDLAALRLRYGPLAPLMDQA